MSSSATVLALARPVRNFRSGHPCKLRQWSSAVRTGRNAVRIATCALQHVAGIHVQSEVAAGRCAWGSRMLRRVGSGMRPNGSTSAANSTLTFARFPFSIHITIEHLRRSFPIAPFCAFLHCSTQAKLPTLLLTQMVGSRQQGSSRTQRMQPLNR